MEILHKKSFNIVGYKIVTEWSNLFIEVPRTWERFYGQLKRIKNRVDNKFFEISLEKDGEVYTELICVEVSEIESIPEGMIGITIPEMNYVFSQHYGNPKNIIDTFRKMYKWANDNGYTTGHFKIDYGYFPDEQEVIDHSLFVKVDY